MEWLALFVTGCMLVLHGFWDQSVSCAVTENVLILLV